MLNTKRPPVATVQLLAQSSRRCNRFLQHWIKLGKQISMQAAQQTQTQTQTPITCRIKPSKHNIKDASIGSGYLGLDGTWTKTRDLTVHLPTCAQGGRVTLNIWTEDELTVTLGTPGDRAGNIWEANFVPSERDALSESKSVRFLLVNCRCESTSPEQVITRMHYIVSESAEWGQQVDQFQQESINDYSPISNNEIQNYSSTRVFTYDGAPTRNGILLSKFSRVAPFKITAVHDGVDLRKSLSEFLLAHQMQDLIPDQSGPSQSATAQSSPYPNLTVPNPNQFENTLYPSSRSK